MTDEVRRAADLLRGSRWTAVLTGGGEHGVGPAGFPVPRDLWAGVDPAQVASLSAFERDPDAFYLRASAPGAVLVDARGILLGVQPRARYSAVEPGDVLALFTDGIVDPRNAAREQFGDRQLRELLASFRGVGPEDIADRAMDAVARWTGTGPADGQALVACLSAGGDLPITQLSPFLTNATISGVKVSAGRERSFVGESPDETPDQAPPIRGVQETNRKQNGNCIEIPQSQLERQGRQDIVAVSLLTCGH